MEVHIVGFVGLLTMLCILQFSMARDGFNQRIHHLLVFIWSLIFFIFILLLHNVKKKIATIKKNPNFMTIFEISKFKFISFFYLFTLYNNIT